jgi:hypothetical protein
LGRYTLSDSLRIAHVRLCPLVLWLLQRHRSEAYMSDTRRSFLKVSSALAAGLTGVSAGVPSAAVEGGAIRTEPSAPVQVPKMKFGNVEISRLILGTNPFYGFSHFNANLDNTMRQWYTPDRICEVMRSCENYGINAFNYVNWKHTHRDLKKYYDEGGKMHLVAQIMGDPAPTWKEFRPMAMYNQGEEVDKAFNSGHMDTVKDWCSKARDLGTIVGVGTHRPDVIAYVEDHGWDIDFYAGCLYDRTRTSEQWKQLLNGQIQEVPQETYLKDDPARMYKVMRQTKKPCFAFKVLAAGRINDQGVDQAFRTAFESLKPIDGVFVGMWPSRKDEIRENAETVTRILTQRG